jgi:selenocysteine lyase/cysteine desulfurase
VSPAWFPWIGTAPALELLLEIGIDAIHDHNLRLANRLRAGLGLPPGDSAIVSAALAEAEERLRGTRVMAAARAGLLRTSWHVYNTDEDVDELLGLLGR